MTESEIREVIAREAVGAGIDPVAAIAEILPRAVIGTRGDGTVDAFVVDRGTAIPVKDAVTTLPPPPAPKTADEQTASYMAARRGRAIPDIAPHAMSTEQYVAWRRSQR